MRPTRFRQRACTRRYLGPAGGADTVGMAAEIVYMRSLLDKLKIEVDFMHVGKFKSGPEPLQLPRLTLSAALPP